MAACDSVTVRQCEIELHIRHHYAGEESEVNYLSVLLSDVYELK